MADFESLSWVKQPVDGDFARAIRKDVRLYRRERGRGGHRFSMNFIKTLWVADDSMHAVLNHIDDLVWQMFYRHPTQGWLLIHWYDTRREAQAAAESDHPELVSRRPTVHPGINVLANFPHRDNRMRVHCSSDYTATVVEETFVKIGCITAREVVPEAVA